MSAALHAVTCLVRDYDEAIAWFRENRRQEAYGTVAVFENVHGNGWDLIQPK